MKKQKDRYLINRVMYKNIKKYDHQQMEEFLTDVYKNGYQDGRESVPGIELEDVKTALRGTKGNRTGCMAAHHRTPGRSFQKGEIIMVKKKTWQEFRKTGLLWFMNTILHAFG